MHLKMKYPLVDAWGVRVVAFSINFVDFLPKAYVVVCFFNPLYTGKPKMGTLENNEEPDEIGFCAVCYD